MDFTFLQMVMFVDLTGALAMSVALPKCYPYKGWSWVCRSLAWPITLFELITGRL